MRRALLAITLLLAACSGELAEASAFVQPDLIGAVHIPLTTTRADGTTYSLRDATVEIGGAALLTLSSSQARDHAPGRDALSTPLPPGSYSLYLRPGYHLVKVDPSGGEHVVEGAEVTHNPLHFTVRDLEDATLKLSFAHDGAKVTFGLHEAVRVTSL